jgi:hypothetical protein
VIYQGQIQMSFRGLGVSITSSIWQQLYKFGSDVKSMFEDQFYPMNCILVGLEGYATQNHQMHIFKKSYIKPHVDVFDLEASCGCV